MPRKVTRGREEPEGGVTAAMTGIGWVFGYGMVTPVSPLALAARNRVAFRSGAGPAPEGLFVVVLSSPSGGVHRDGQAYAPVTSAELWSLSFSLRGGRPRDATDCS
ncbi:hypothetical protein GCM10009541_28590 [Micromonospora gifhornensis]|uniref:Uncharacterized protein n=1 Tax=Micromonospora gifhornensis TaxID=84594 RepID=A0ABQ4I8H9_9ACTN|nr:hypothetical protein Vgi01_07750 [Micromonospora gifhornensis]